MKQSNLKSEYNKISILTKMEVKRILNQLTHVIPLVLLVILLFNIFIFIAQSYDVRIQAKIALAIEDNTFEVNTLAGNIADNKLKGVITFERSSLAKGLELLEKDEVIAVIHVEQGTTTHLYRGEPAALNLYTNDNSNITVKFLIKYLENMVEVLNEGQNGALVYWNIMKEEGFKFDERLKELNKIALNYMGAFLIRGDVFENAHDLDKFAGLSLINYYFTTALLVIAIISAILFHLDINDDFKKGTIRRLLYSGFGYWHIYGVKLLVGVAFSTLLVTFFQGIFMLFFSVFSLAELLRIIVVITLLNVIIQMFILIFYNLIKNDLLRDWSLLAVFLIISFTGGLILPLDSLGKIVRDISRFNILTIGHQLLAGHSLTTGIISIISLHFFLLLAALSFIQRKRRG